MSGDGEWHIVGPVVVDRYTPTRQKWLRAKIVKFSHGRHYKKRPIVVYRNNNNHKHEILKT